MSQYSFLGQRQRKKFQIFENVTTLIVSSVVRGTISQLKSKHESEFEVVDVTKQLEKKVLAYFQKKCFKYAAERVKNL